MEGRWHLVDQSEAIEENLLDAGVLRRDGMDMGSAAQNGANIIISRSSRLVTNTGIARFIWNS